MPKATKSGSKSPTKSPPKPRPVRSPKKKAPQFVDDQAEESDDGVVVDRPSNDSPDENPIVHDGEGSHPTFLDSDDAYEEDFINDGNPYEGADGDGGRSMSPEITPPPSFKRLSTRTQKDAGTTTSPKKTGRVRAASSEPPSVPSPSKRTKKAVQEEAVIDLGSTSEEYEDLGAMDVDDSMFKKPAGVKSAAFKRTSEGETSGSTAPISRASRDIVNGIPSVTTDADLLANIPKELRVPPIVVDGRIAPHMLGWVTALSHHNSTSAVPASSSVGSSGGRRRSDRVDHDQVALDQALRTSLTDKHSPSSSRTLERYSPDWEEFPTAEELYEGATVKRASGSASKVASAGKTNVKDRRRPVSPDQDDPFSAPSGSPAKQTARVSTVGARKTSKRGVDTGLSIDSARGSTNKPVASAASTLLPSQSKTVAPVTMSQMKRSTVGGAADAEKDESRDVTPPIRPDQPFMSDLLTYKTNYNETAPCGVYNPAIQDPMLDSTYLGLCPLPPRKRVVPVYDRNRSSLADIDWETGGRIRYSSWCDQAPRMLADNSMGAMLFRFAEPNFINLSRITPFDLSSRVSQNSSQTARLYVGERVAVCVSAICSVQSCLVVPQKIGPKTELMRKWLSGVFHDQDWERFESMLCLVFGEDILYGQITDKAISFQSMSSDAKSSSSVNNAASSSVPTSMYSTPRSPSKNKNRAIPSGQDGTKTMLACEERVPVYDARKTSIDFQSDLNCLKDALPAFEGEIPTGSFCVVGYTCTVWKKAITGSTGLVPNLGLNILWVIVCGTPSLRR